MPCGIAWPAMLCPVPTLSSGTKNVSCTALQGDIGTQQFCHRMIDSWSLLFVRISLVSVHEIMQQVQIENVTKRLQFNALSERWHGPNMQTSALHYSLLARTNGVLSVQ